MELGYIPLKKEKSLYTWIGVIIVLMTTIITGCLTEFKINEAIIALPGVLSFIATDFLPPEITIVPEFFPSLLDTIYMAFISTTTGAVFSLILALLCANPTTPHPVVKLVIRAFASLLRNIPALAWAIIFVPAFGIGKTVGLLALVLGSMGSMIRLFTETIEEIDIGSIEAIRTTGGTYWQVLKNGVLPQCFPGIISWSLYNFELDIRASAIIGMVGGGGIGFFIQFTIKLFRYKQATMAILTIAIIILLTESISKKIRERMM